MRTVNVLMYPGCYSKISVDDMVGVFDCVLVLLKNKNHQRQFVVANIDVVVAHGHG